MKKKSIVVGLASFGMSGRIFHAPFIEKNPNFKLKLILERTKNNSKEFYPKATIVRSFNELLDDSEIDLIVINTPSYLHYEMTKSALLTGKNVIVEKPFTATSIEGEELIQLAKTKNLLLSVYHNKRFEGDFNTIKTLLNEKRLGNLTHFQIALHRYKPEIGLKKWKENNIPAAGLLYDIGSHLIDQCLQLFGWPTNLQADLQKQRENSGVTDYFKITLNYNGFDAVIISDMLTKKNNPTYSIKGINATFIKYGRDTQEATLNLGNVDWLTLGKEAPEYYGILTSNLTGEKETITTEQRSYMEYYQNIFDTLTNKSELLVPPQQALDVVKIIEWAQNKQPSN